MTIADRGSRGALGQQADSPLRHVLRGQPLCRGEKTNLVHFPKQMGVFCCLRVSQCSQAKGSGPTLRPSDKLLPWHPFHELTVPLRIFFSYLFSSWLEQMFLVPMAMNLPPFLMGIFLVKGTAQPLHYKSRVRGRQAPHCTGTLWTPVCLDFRSSDLI